MKTKLPVGIAHFALLALACLSQTVFADSELPRITANELRADIEFIRQTVARTHPDLRFSTSPDALARVLDDIEKGLASSMTRDEAWRNLAKLNPIFADGHLFVGFPEWPSESLAHLGSGGRFFPYEVNIHPDGKLFIRAKLGGGGTDLEGARIVSINGVESDAATSALLARSHGDTPVFRANLLAQRWWLYHWKMYGATAHYRLTLARGDHQWSVDVPGSSSTPTVLRDGSDFDRLFRLKITPDCAAVLTVASFEYDHKDRFLAFTREAFTRIRKEGIETLVIDISANGGGDDQPWLEGLMPYIASQPYRTGSTYIKKVIEPNMARGEIAGQVVNGAIETWHAPQLDNPLLFKGRIYVVVGPSTYSSAVLFANVMRDFRFGTLVGTGGAARRAQSGGLRKFVLPHAKLAIFVPRFVLDPPIGLPRRDVLLEPETNWERVQFPACAREGIRLQNN